MLTTHFQKRGHMDSLIETQIENQAAETASQESSIERIVATVENEAVARLEARLNALEQRFAELEARSASAPMAASAAHESGRKTLPAAASQLAAKHGLTQETMQAGAIDAALVHLSLEQRIAVKSQLLRAGLLG